MVKAKAEITLSRIVDIASVTRYYLLQSSTATAPTKPTANPPGGNWKTTEPSYTSGSTNTLYFVDLTVMTNDTFGYSEVSKSSSYEAAKEAYNKAQAAQNTANNVQNALDVSLDVIVGTQTAVTGSWTGVAKFASLKDGQQIVYWLPYNGSGNATLNLTLSGGSTTGAKNVYYSGTTRVTTHYPAGNAIRLIYQKAAKIGSATYEGWWCDANYDSNIFDRTAYSQSIKAGATALVAGNIIVGKNGVYSHLKTGDSFDISYPILYCSSAIAANTASTWKAYLAIPFSVSTTQSITLVAYKPVYIKGKLSGQLFTPASTAPLTQTTPSSEDGYHYILLGNAYSTTSMYLLPEHPIFQYFKDGFKSVEQIAVEAAKTATNYMNFDSKGLVIGDMTASTLGNNVLIDSDSVDIRSGDTVLASYSGNDVYIGKNNKNSTIDFCNGTAQMSRTIDNTYGKQFVIESSDVLSLKSDYAYKFFANSTDSLHTATSMLYGWSYDVISTEPYAYMELVTETTTNSSGNRKRATLKLSGSNIHGEIMDDDTGDMTYFDLEGAGFYVNDNAIPTAEHDGYYWGMGDPAGGTSNWIRTTSAGLIPYKSGGASSLGTSSWPFGRVFTNYVYCGKTVYGSTSIELYGPTPFIDFHYNNSTADYTSRIIESASGTISINGVTITKANTSIVCSQITTSSIFSGSAMYFRASCRTDNIGHYMGFFRESSNDLHRTILRSEETGKIYLGTGNYRFNTAYFTNAITASDLKEKAIIEDFDFKIEDFVMGLKPIAYRRTGSGDNGKRIHMGFGAQHVSELIRELGIGDMSVVQASVLKDEEVTKPDENGQEKTQIEKVEYTYRGEDIDDSKLCWGLNYNEFIAPIVLMIQKQQQNINELKQIVKELKGE